MTAFSGLFFREHVTTNLNKNKPVLEEDGEMNLELLYRSRTEEIRGWRQNSVLEKIGTEKMPKGTKVFNVRWVDTCRSGTVGTETIEF